MKPTLPALALLFIVPTTRAAAPPAAVDYLIDIKPVLKERCFACHGSLQQKGGLRLDTAALLRQGGDSGSALDENGLLDRLTTKVQSRRMPRDGEPLSAGQIDKIRTWVNQGAKGPAGEKPEPDPLAHWAFRRPARPQVPAGEGNPIDRFLRAAWKDKQLHPAPPADRATLVRRVYLDLTGLPPTRDELRDALAMTYERLVDRLLASPRHGERWGRHWMDVWRYSDWYGRRNVPDVLNSYGMIWRWRDWIVRSLNEDRPYDRMVQEMLAADELCPTERDKVVATGFLVRNFFRWNYNNWMRDNVEHTAKAFLGLTVQCAQCHDHKYDPVTQVDYFRFRAFFEPLEIRHDRVPGEPDPGPYPKYSYGAAYKPITTGLVRVFDEKLDAPTWMYSKGDERDRVPGKPPVKPGAPAAFGGDRLVIAPVDLPREAHTPGPLAAHEKAAREAGKPPAKDTPNFPAYPAKSTGRRLALARWITSRDNPLTARVAVNHVWGWHFGQPLVESTANFGRQGSSPTHPELLDWLACELMDSGWRFKSLHRLIVTSEAYRMASSHPADASNRERDPDNKLLWRFPPRRLEAEVVRDSLLHCAGELDGRLGGPEIAQDQGLTVPRRSLYFAHHGETRMAFLDLFDAANPTDCYRRAASVRPQQALALANSELTLTMARKLAARFDGSGAAEPPGLSRRSGQRGQTPPLPEDAAFVRAAFEQVLAREPTAAELAASAAFLAKQAELFRTMKLTTTPGGPSADPARRARENLLAALFNHTDFVTLR